MTDSFSLTSKFRPDYRFTDANGNKACPTLAEFLVDSSSNDPIIVPARPLATYQEAPYVCEACGSGDDVDTSYPPCVMRCKTGESIEPTIWADSDTPVTWPVHQAFCTLEIALCPQCTRRLDILKGRQDHLAIGYDYWDIHDAAIEHLTDDRWGRHTKSKIRNAHLMATEAINEMCDNKNGLFGSLNADVVGVIGDKLKDAYIKSSVDSIQDAWLKHSQPCDDCGSRRLKWKLCNTEAGSGIDGIRGPFRWHGVGDDVSQKTVCNDACGYLCKDCKCVMYVPWYDMRLLEVTGDRTVHCESCGGITEVPMYWED